MVGHRAGMQRRNTIRRRSRRLSRRCSVLLSLKSINQPMTMWKTGVAMPATVGAQKKDCIPGHSVWRVVWSSSAGACVGWRNYRSTVPLEPIGKTQLRPVASVLVESTILQGET